MELVILVCEGGFYLANIQGDNLSERAIQSKAQRYGRSYHHNKRFQSLSHVREFFEPLAPQNVWLEHNGAYDEMIGSASSGYQHRQPLYWYGEDNQSPPTH